MDHMNALLSYWLAILCQAYHAMNLIKLCYLIQLNFHVFLHSLQMINILRQMKKFLVDLMTWLCYNMIHQPVGYFWVTTTKIMYPFSFWWINLPFSREFLLKKTLLVSFLIFCLLIASPSAFILLWKLILE